MAYCILSVDKKLSIGRVSRSRLPGWKQNDPQCCDWKRWLTWQLTIFSGAHVSTLYLSFSAVPSIQIGLSGWHTLILYLPKLPNCFLSLWLISCTWDKFNRRVIRLVNSWYCCCFNQNVTLKSRFVGLVYFRIQQKLSSFLYKSTAYDC